MDFSTEKLRLIMMRMEIGTRELAENAKISQASVSKYANGNAKPSLKTIGKIANAIGIDVTELLETKKEQTQ